MDLERSDSAAGVSADSESGLNVLMDAINARDNERSEKVI
jgi:hypothetical protein